MYIFIEWCNIIDIKFFWVYIVCYLMFIFKTIIFRSCSYILQLFYGFFMVIVYIQNKSTFNNNYLSIFNNFDSITQKIVISRDVNIKYISIVCNGKYIKCRKKFYEWNLRYRILLLYLHRIILFSTLYLFYKK